MIEKKPLQLKLLGIMAFGDKCNCDRGSGREEARGEGNEGQGGREGGEGGGLA